MIQINLEPSTEASLHELAAELHVSAEFVAKQAIGATLEDRADYRAGVQSLAEMKYTISQDEMERRSELVD